jgi:hypothetical protein
VNQRLWKSIPSRCGSSASVTTLSTVNHQPGPSRTRSCQRVPTPVGPLGSLTMVTLARRGMGSASWMSASSSYTAAAGRVVVMDRSNRHVPAACSPEANIPRIPMGPAHMLT